MSNGRGLPVQAQTAPAPGERTKAAVAPGVESGGLIALTTATTGSAQLLYLIDSKAHAFAIYRVDPTNPKGTVKLEAARQYTWDLKLAEYNNMPPEVAAIESTVKTLGHPTR